MRCYSWCLSIWTNPLFIEALRSKCIGSKFYIKLCNLEIGLNMSGRLLALVCSCCCCCTGAGQDVIRRRNLIDIVRSRLFAEQQLRPLEQAECFVTSWAGQLMWPAASSGVHTRPGPAQAQLQYTVNTAITQVSNPSTGIFRWYLWDLQSESCETAIMILSVLMRFQCIYPLLRVTLKMW